VDCEIDADAAELRHGMGGVADVQKPWLVPKRQPVDGDGQELDLIEAFDCANAIGEKRSQRGSTVAEGAYALHLRRSADPLAIT
jgi:hypothetical protein